MEKRRLGRTGHYSSVVAFGGAALWETSPKEAERALNLAFEAGVNHIDIAPEYGEAEDATGHWLKNYRNSFFLACKSFMRKKKEVREELHRSLDRLKTDRFDLYQLHQLDLKSELETVLGPGGGMEAILEARDQGLLKHIGITSHSQAVLMEALSRFDFDTVMFPFNFIFYSHADYRSWYEKLMAMAKQKDIGVIIIKAIAKGNWGERLSGENRWKRPFLCWYEPFTTQEEISRALGFVLSREVATAVAAGDVKLLALVINAAKFFTPMSLADQEALLREAKKYKRLEFIF
jgi:aryl-alcohol dehydrogenase-like predicted oxidoreductase